MRVCRSTGWSNQPQAKRPPNYPVEYFARFSIMPEVISMVIGRLRADDIYNQSAAYPSPEHRSTALATQAAMLYVLLFFSPNILIKEMATMREIVDKHFPDNWVISYYMGNTVDLIEAWETFKAANAALSNVTEKSVVADFNTKFSSKLPKLMASLKQLLTEGVLVEQFVLDNIPKLLNTLRECNTTVRWLTLHRSTKAKKLREMIVASTTADDVLLLLLNTAQFEFLLKNMLSDLLASKKTKWDEYKKECKERMIELAEYFSGEKALTRVKKDENLQGWFTGLANEIDALDMDRASVAGRKIAQIMTALEEVQEFHQIETSLQIKQFLADTRQYLTKMIRTANIKDEVLATISIVSDFSYAWEIILDYIPLMHARIKQDPSCVLFLRATFLKLVSILDLPLLRINQCNSKDVMSVSEYYSGALVRFVRSVLEVIPQSMFNILNEIINLLTYQLKPLPIKVERLQLKDFAQLEQRFVLSRATHQVSVFTEGILAMDRTLYGVVEVDPKQMLEDGIRKELVRQITTALHELLVFKSGKQADFEGRLVALGAKLDGFKRSFEYIQDYVNIYGLKIWQEEFSRIINYSVEQESNLFLKKKIFDWQSEFQSDAIPIPKFMPTDKESVNFTGRLARELLRNTDVRSAVYLESMQGWYDSSEREIVGIRTFDLLNKGVGVLGLAGLDKLISFMIVRDMQAWVRFYRKTIDQGLRQFVAEFSAELAPTTRLSSSGRLYPSALQRTSKLWPVWLDLVCKFGQSQLIRRHIANELKFTAQMDAKVLTASLQNVNDALLADVKQHYIKPDTKPYPDDKNPILSDLDKMLDMTGIQDPFTKIYITTEPLEGFACLMFIFVLSQCTKLSFNAKFNALVRNSKSEPIDGAPFVIGVITLLKQFHFSYTETFLAYLGQFVRFSVSAAAASDSPPQDIPAEVDSVILFLDEFCKYAHVPRTHIETLVPAYLFDRCKI